MIVNYWHTLMRHCPISQHNKLSDHPDAVWKIKTPHTKATIIMFDIVFILLFGRLQPHKTADSSDTPVTFGSSAAGSALIYLCIRIGTIILYGSISEAINSLPLILFQTICMFGCLVLYFKMLRTASDPKYRHMIYWVLGILLGLILSLLSVKLFYLMALFIYSFFGRTIGWMPAPLFFRRPFIIRTHQHCGCFEYLHNML